MASQEGCRDAGDTRPGAGLARWREAATQRLQWFASAAGSRPPFRALVRSCSGCRGPGAVLVLDDGDGLPLSEPGAGGECLIELAWA
jgi:hypothetical protein